MRWTTHSATVACGQTIVTASGSPVRGVAADDAHVTDPAVAELGEDGEPELG